jgi:hypothetical protein
MVAMRDPGAMPVLSATNRDGSKSVGTTFFPIQESDRTVSRQSVGSMTSFPAAGSTRVTTAAIDYHLLFRLLAIKNELIGQDLLVLALSGNWLRAIQPSPLSAGTGS